MYTKNVIKSFLVSCVFTAFAVSAEPAMNLVTINTQDTAGYVAWLKGSSKAIANATNASTAGICRPIAGAEEEGDLYVWFMADSQQKLAEADPQSDAIMAEVAKITVKRTIKTRDIWRVVRTEGVASNNGGPFSAWNILVKTSDIGGYLNALNALKSSMNENGLEDTVLNAFVADTGKWAGMVMVSLQAPTGGRLGAAMDARTSPWFTEALSDLQGIREYVHGWVMSCEVTYAGQAS